MYKICMYKYRNTFIGTPIWKSISINVFIYEHEYLPQNVQIDNKIFGHNYTNNIVPDTLENMILGNNSCITLLWILERFSNSCVHIILYIHNSLFNFICNIY